MIDQNTNRPRGFGFITFDTEDAVDRATFKTFHELGNKLVEVKRALPKDASPGAGGRGGGYQGYGSSGGNASSFDSRMDGNRYLQPQTTGGGYPPYTNYGAPSYGYGAATGSAGYGSYGSYGVSGYASANAGFSGPPGAYGSPSAGNTGYVSGPAGALKNSWNSMTPGYGASGYGANAGYGASIPWSAPGSGGAGSYINSGGYPSVGGRDGSVQNSNAAGGASGTEQQGTSGGYLGNAYGSSNVSPGYSNAVWRSE
ncbi:unnamed protein product [Ilex paraguariensis]|uniref:RRM domain-containing protein n=1 Tax=Ilex paraguariensis TaxID=185542 RepID=A0ABC8SYK7_9AQUA